MTEYKNIPGYEGRYAISRAGEVYSFVSGRPLNPHLARNGYRSMILWRADGHRGNFLIHRLVARTFLGEPTGPVVRHLDGNSLNNDVSNLAYGTAAENTADSIRHGTFRSMNGERTECRRGHEFNEANTEVRSRTGAPGVTRRACRTCREMKRRARRRKAAGHVGE